jgi:hypothetical protein
LAAAAVRGDGFLADNVRVFGVFVIEYLPMHALRAHNSIVGLGSHGMKKARYTGPFRYVFSAE